MPDFGVAGPRPPEAEVEDAYRKIVRERRQSASEAERKLEAAKRTPEIRRPSGDRAKGYRKVG